MTFRVLSSVTIPTISAIRGRASWSGRQLSGSSVKRSSDRSFDASFSSSSGTPRVTITKSLATILIHFGLFNYALNFYMFGPDSIFSTYCIIDHYNAPMLIACQGSQRSFMAGLSNLRAVTYSRHHLEDHETTCNCMDLLVPKRTHRLADFKSWLAWDGMSSKK